MKKIILIAMFIICANSILLIAEDSDVYQHGSYSVGANVYLFGDKVNVRDKADLKGKALDQLPVGTKITVKEIMKETATINNYSEAWYKVEYKNSLGKNGIGYVWGGLIAKGFVEGDFNNDKINEMVLYGITKSDKNGRKTAEARLVAAGKIINSIYLDVIETTMGDEKSNLFYYYTIESKKIGDVGFKPQLSIIRFSAIYEACEYMNGDILVATDGIKLYSVMKAIRMSNESASIWYELTYPNDKDGIANTIICVEKNDVTDEDGVSQGVNVQSRILYIWDGKEFKEKIVFQKE